MSETRCLLLSNSTLHGAPYLEWAKDYIIEFLLRYNIKSVIFIPYALKDVDKYTETAQKAFAAWGFQLTGSHTYKNPKDAVENAESIFIGGGNTFRLLKELYDKDIVESIRKRVKDGVPYIGSSAGTNVATVSINTTNDMPIVYPPTFQALSLIPFNINPHYIDADSSSTHMGETREQRINQFHEESDTPVLALREGSLVDIAENSAVLKGKFPARLFKKGISAVDYPVGSDFSFLL